MWKGNGNLSYCLLLDGGTILQESCRKEIVICISSVNEEMEKLSLEGDR